MSHGRRNLRLWKHMLTAVKDIVVRTNSRLLSRLTLRSEWSSSHILIMVYWDPFWIFEPETGPSSKKRKMYFVLTLTLNMPSRCLKQESPEHWSSIWEHYRQDLEPHHKENRAKITAPTSRDMMSVLDSQHQGKITSLYLWEQGSHTQKDRAPALVDSLGSTKRKTTTKMNTSKLK